MDPHVPYHPREPWASAYARADGVGEPDARDRYDSEIHYVDERVRELYERLGLEHAVVVITADHGEAFGEHGVAGHGNDLHAEVVNVPLLIHLPQGGVGSVEQGPRSVDVPVSTLDLYPTLRALVGGAPDPQQRGRSLWPLIAGDAPEPEQAPDLFAQLVRKERGRPHTLMTAVVSEEWKLLDDTPLTAGGSERSRLYNWREDPGELSDLAAAVPLVVADLRARVLALGGDTRNEGLRYPLDPATVEHLRSLGYAD